MKTTLVLTGVTDRPKAMAWLRSQGRSLQEITAFVNNLPAVLRTDEFNVRHWAPYCGDLEALRKALADETIGGVAPASMLVGGEATSDGFSYEMRVEFSDDEKRLVNEQIKHLEEAKAAEDWYAAQSDDVRKKVNILISRSMPRA